MSTIKTIGIIGGMSWESSASYYRLINQEIARRLGGYHSAHLILYSVDFAEIEAYQRQDDWARAGTALADAALRCVAAGAEILALATNTMHLVADEVARAAGVPFIHIADATARAVRGMDRVLLLGTRFTMEREFFRERIESAGIPVTVPDAPERRRIDGIIFDELVHGVIREESRRVYREIIARHVAPGQGVILGCTEIGLLIQQEDVAVPVFDTTAVHARALVEDALSLGGQDHERPRG